MELADDPWHRSKPPSRGIPGIQHHPSQFADTPAWCVDGRKFVHFGSDGSVDLRLTRSHIRDRRPQFRADRRVPLRRTSSDWLEIDASAGLDDALIELFRLAAEANRPATLDGLRDPGRIVARARKRHGGR